jgi:hypothetical protein
MVWVKGESGNPNGRPRKIKSLTEILARELAKTIPDGEDRRVAVKRFMAMKVTEALTTGKITIADGKFYDLEPNEWVDLLKWSYNRVDGLPRQPTEHSGPDGGPLIIKWVDPVDPNET